MRQSHNLEKAFDLIVWSKNCAAHDIQRTLRVSSVSTWSYISKLLLAKRICCIGNALDVGRRDIHHNSKIYAVAGTPVLKKHAPRVFKEKGRVPENKAGSGVVAPPAYIRGFRCGNV